jgi:myo-inositol-1(or 4)-monophosphatase
MDGHFSELLGVAVRAARLAGDVILANIGGLSSDDINQKRASDFVTKVDIESENIIIKSIRESFPDHAILAEESLKDNNTDGFKWIIDPLDGTTNYIHGYPVFSVSIAAAFKDEVMAGVIFDPLRNELFTAQKGKGAFLNDKLIKVSDAGMLKESLISTGFPFRKKENIDRYLMLFRNLFYKVGDIRRAGSAAIDLAYVASGRCDGFFELGLGPWDIAAGSIIIKEAGGVITDFGGGVGYLETGNIVAGPPALHSEMLKEVRKVFESVIDK